LKVILWAGGKDFFEQIHVTIAFCALQVMLRRDVGVAVGVGYQKDIKTILNFFYIMFDLA
jgi:hypothetical protein